MSFELNYFKWGKPQFGRPSGTITFGFDAAFYTSLQLASGSFGDFQNAAEAALDTWASVAQLDFQYTASATSADLVFTAASLPGTQIGEALTRYVEAGTVDEVTSALVTFDADRAWSPFGESGVNFYNVALHEVGHTLGLGHPDAEDEAMYAFYDSDDTVSLGAGDIAGVQFIYGSAILSGTAGDDVIDRSWSFSGVNIEALAGNDIVNGSQGDDSISGGAGDDILNGFDGDDVVFDFLGDNTLDGGAGMDVLVGGIGRNDLSGGTGNDLLLGGTGGDTLSGGSGLDVIIGDPDGFALGGNDRIDGGLGSDLMMGGPGADVFVFANTGGDDLIARLDIDYRDPLASTAVGADFTPGLDKIELAPGTFVEAAALFEAIETVSGSAVITLGGTTMTLFGVTEADLSSDDFIFAGAVG